MEAYNNSFRPTSSDLTRIGRDFSEAIKQLLESPEKGEAILAILNSRLRPLGVRVELLGHETPDVSLAA